MKREQLSLLVPGPCRPFRRCRVVAFVAMSVCFVWIITVAFSRQSARKSARVHGGHETAANQRCLHDVVHHKLPFLLHQYTASHPAIPQANSTPKDMIHIVIASNGPRLVGMMALVNSIDKNTNASVFFHLVTDKPGAVHIRLWMERASELQRIKKEIIVFDKSLIEGKYVANSRVSYRVNLLSDPLNFARFYLDRLVPGVLGRLLYIDDDCIVQGDIREMAATKIAENHVVAFSSGCNAILSCVHPNAHHYDSYLNYKLDIVRKIGIPHNTCQFNAGVFAVDMDKFRRWNISARLEYWSVMNVKHHLFLEGASQPPVMIVFYNLYSELDPRWNVLHLGTAPSKVPSYSDDFIYNHARLLHWDGSRKPWLYPKQIGADIWRRYAVRDPVAPEEINL